MSLHSTQGRYGAALLSVALGILIRGMLHPVLDVRSPYLVFSLAVMASAWLGGPGPGLLATALGAAAGCYFSLASGPLSPAMLLPDLVQVALFVVVGSGITALTGALHAAQQRAQASAHEAHERREGHGQLIEGLRVVAGRARCLLWYAEVEDRGERSLFWDLKVADEEAARRFFPVEIPPGLTYVQAWYESRLPGDKARMDDYGEQQARMGRSYSQEFRCRRADGEIRWLAEDVQIEPLAPGRWRAVGVCFDTTEHKRLAVELRESEERLRLALDAAQLGTWDWDLATGVINWSPGHARLFGYDPYSVSPSYETWRARVHPDDITRVEASIDRASRERAEFRDEYRIVRPDGGVRWIEGVGRVNCDASGEAVRMIGVVRDVTERKRLEEELRHHVDDLAQADQRKDQFLAMLAHELRNPLAPIRNAVQLLQQLGPPDERLARARAIIERQVRHQSRLLDDLLDVSRITRGKVELRREPLDLVRLTRDAAEDARGVLEQAGLTMGLDLPEEPIWVEGDAIRLAQVLGNVLNNAAKFTDPGGRVGVRCWVLGVGELSPAPNTQHLTPNTPFAAVSVRDTGIGIDRETLPHIFETFSQGDRSLDRSRGGLGLGLALVKGLVELHGGQVRVDSAGFGCGAEFTLLLPLAPAPTTPAAAALPAPSPGGPIRVLIVEDNRDAAETLRDLLELAGCHVEVAYTGPAGLEAASRFHPEVVLCDLGLPGMDGYAVATALRRAPNTAGARMLAISGYGQEEDRRRSQEAGFDMHLTKPIDLDELHRLLEVAPQSRPA